MSAEQRLIVIKVAHTAIWAVMATAIIALPISRSAATFAWRLGSLH